MTWKVPGTLGPADWQARIYQGIVLVTSPHSNFLFAYGSDGKLMWKRDMSWPMTESPRLVNGQLLFQQPGQPAVLVQPETGETRQILPRDHSGWTVPRDAKSWIQLGDGGQLLSGNKEWTEWKNLGHLRLQRGDQWLGPPVLVGSTVYLGTARGHLHQVDLQSGWRSATLGTQLPRPLLPPSPHPLGVVEVTVSGLLALRSNSGNWIKPFPGWSQCYSGSGEILARPAVDDDGNIYLATRHQVASWDAGGRRRWTLPLRCASAVAWKEGGCYLADTSPAIVKLDPATGTVLSRLPLSAGVASDPAVEKTLMAVVLNNGEVMVHSNLP
ncbi:MAG: PQQ-binding-like beta-propeller repeat protein [Candidatus Eremiobacteraeota bacterium]|nr:PQQ-binding-like beta-propeller repeat protein [Candidatus Eremiobacteraeota bacterium]MCW5868504.1 PQQ-binding-like beta-propeller repeat protein [Candidatus Eremiobacteraeota bacterium]